MSGDPTGSTERAFARPNDLALDLDLSVPPEHELGRALGLDTAKNALRHMAREIMLAQLTLAHWRGRQMMYSRDRTFYSNVRRYRHRALSYVRTVEAMDELRVLELIDHQVGSKGHKWRYRSRARLHAEAHDALPISCVGELSFVPNEVIRLKNEAKALIRYRDTCETQDMRQEIFAHNEAIASLDVQLKSPNWTLDNRGLLRSEGSTINPQKRNLYRIFNCSWREGGRLYGGWWQNLPEADRQCLQINDRDVTELDYDFINPTLMAAGARVSWGNGDPYVVDGFPRKQSKSAFQILLNAPTMLKARRAVTDDLRSRGVAEASLRAEQLIKALTDRHPQFERFWGSGLGRRLQRIDSDLCTNILAALRAKGVVGLSVHDSVIVPEKNRQVLAEIMERELALTCRKLSKNGFQL